MPVLVAALVASHVVLSRLYGITLINDLAQPTFVFALAMGAACFALLVLRRRRG